MLKRKYILIGLSTMTALNFLSFHTENTQAEEVLSTYSSTEDSTISSDASEENSTVDSSISTNSSTEKSEIEQATQDSTTDTSTVQETTDETKTSEQSTKEKKIPNQNSRVANFNLSDWQYTETADTITLNKYTGTSSDITIPAESNNKQVVIPSIQAIQLPSTMTNLSFQAKNNRQVIVNSSDMSVVFQNNKVIENVDFSGLNMDNITNINFIFSGCSNLQTVDFGSNTLSQVTDITAMFQNCSNLINVLGSWTLDSVRKMENVFLNCTLLKNVDVSRWNLKQVSSLAQLFSNCNNLQKLDTSSWDTSNITNLYCTFQNCVNLANIDVSNWNVAKVTNVTNLFTDCRSINTLDMSNWHFSNTINLDGWFYTSRFGYHLLIFTEDPQILNYDYESDWRFPYGPYLNPNGGTLGTNIPYNNEYGKYCYLGSPAIRPDDPRIQDSTFKQKFSEVINSIPTRKDYAFTQWNVSGTPLENANTFRDLFDTTYTAQWVSSKYSTSVDNTVLTTSDNLDFAYIPTRFTTAATPINNSGNQEIPLLKTETFNIGIKDRTRTNKSWSVTAQLTWDNPQLKDTYIQTYNPGGATNQNISTGSAPYDPSKDLVVNQDGVNGIPDVKISTSAPIPIMESNSQTNKNAVYDYGLGEAKLVIPETQNIQVGSYTGNVEWNLISAP
ncbi:BspA family leucine-rich repeat surface protein [Enterococcus hirae]|uniref:BspA family leucine-rich repeat surface protein n=1 Tax=Enterococcus hirae TaxID=1354 RepID=UPI003D6BE5B5